MAEIKTSVLFKQYNQQQNLLLPPSLEELIGPRHLVRVVNLEHGYIKTENYFCDGSTFRANASQYKMVWKKNAERYKGKTEQKCRELFRQIEELNATEDRQYGNADLEQGGAPPPAWPEESKNRDHPGGYGP